MQSVDRHHGTQPAPAATGATGAARRPSRTARGSVFAIGLFACTPQDEKPRSETTPASTSGAPSENDSQPQAKSAPHEGLPGTLAWRTLGDAKAEAKLDGRPIMLVVHTTWCPRCKELSKQLEDAELIALSERFAMVNLDQDHAPEAIDFASSGTYVPRVLFLDANGRIDETVVNARSPRYPYFYTSAADVLASMRIALAKREPHG